MVGLRRYLADGHRNGNAAPQEAELTRCALGCMLREMYLKDSKSPCHAPGCVKVRQELIPREESMQMVTICTVKQLMCKRESQ